MRKDLHMYIFVFPAILFYLIFHYAPLYFVQIAFKNFRITSSVTDSRWTGLDNFRILFNTPGFASALENTFIISFYKLVFAFPVPIILALLLNELRRVLFKRVVQSILYLPHFISWVVIGGILFNLLSIHGGLVNEILQWFGQEPISFLADKAYFRTILVLSEIWKESGWGTIIYFAALTKISPELYEASALDGANRLKQIWHVTLPGIKDVIIVLLILKIGYILTDGFEQILVLQNNMVLEVGDTLDTFVYRTGLLQARYSYATAAGLFQAVLAGIMLITADRFAKKIGERGLF